MLFIFFNDWILIYIYTLIKKNTNGQVGSNSKDPLEVMITRFLRGWNPFLSPHDSHSPKSLSAIVFNFLFFSFRFLIYFLFSLQNGVPTILVLCFAFTSLTPVIFNYWIKSFKGRLFFQTHLFYFIIIGFLVWFFFSRFGFLELHLSFLTYQHLSSFFYSLIILFHLPFSFWHLTVWGWTWTLIFYFYFYKFYVYLGIIQCWLLSLLAFSCIKLQ